MRVCGFDANTLPNRDALNACAMVEDCEVSSTMIEDMKSRGVELKGDVVPHSCLGRKGRRKMMIVL